MEKTPYRKLILSVRPFVAFVIFASTAQSQLLPSVDVLEDPLPTMSGLELNLVPFVQLPPGQNPILAAVSPPHDRRLFVTNNVGRIHVVERTRGSNNEPANGFLGTSTEWFDIRDQIAMNRDQGGHGGLRSVAFHPEFETNGKFYISTMIDRPDDPSTAHYLGSSTTGAGIRADSALVEFTFDHTQNQVMPNSARELFRIQIPVYDHPIKQITFNPFAESGDEDYGLLYVNHGDAATQASDFGLGGGQNPDDALGKVLRINPLASGDLPYSIPVSNPFASASDGTLPEIYAMGLRNPHNLSFALDAQGDAKLLVADIGRAHIEEVNIIEAGGNYGWSVREGPLVHTQSKDSRFLRGIEPLPEDEANNGFSYPATMISHGPELVDESLAIAGSHVIANGSELTGQYVFADFGSSGIVWHAALEDLLAATTTLDPNDPVRDEPGELTYAQPSRMTLTLNGEPFETMTDVLGAPRSDLRFGQGHLGELYITSKRNGMVYLVENSMPLPGDVNFDGTVQFADFLVFSRNFSQPGDWWQGDFDGDGEVGFPDFLALSRNFGESNFTSSVPEPSMPLTFLGGVILIGVLGTRRGRLTTKYTKVQRGNECTA